LSFHHKILPGVFFDEEILKKYTRQYFFEYFFDAREYFLSKNYSKNIPGRQKILKKYSRAAFFTKISDGPKMVQNGPKRPQMVPKYSENATGSIFGAFWDHCLVIRDFEEKSPGTNFRVFFEYFPETRGFVPEAIFL